MIKICCLRKWARLCFNFCCKRYQWKTACRYSRHPPPPHPSDPFCHAVTGTCRYPSVPASPPGFDFLPAPRPPKKIKSSSRPSTAQENQILIPPIITCKNCIYRHSFDDPSHCKNRSCMSCAWSMQIMIKICCLRKWARLCFNFCCKRYQWKTACRYSRHPPPPHPSEPFYQILTEFCRQPSVPATRPDLIFCPPHDRPGKSNPLPHPSQPE